MSDWRLLQVFLSPTARGVYEVSADEQGQLSCTCPGFRTRHTCKHYEFVSTRVREQGGEYTIAVPCVEAEDLVRQALRSPAAYREFVLRYGTVEVL